MTRLYWKIRTSVEHFVGDWSYIRRSGDCWWVELKCSLREQFYYWQCVLLDYWDDFRGIFSKKVRDRIAEDNKSVEDSMRVIMGARNN